MEGQEGGRGEGEGGGWRLAELKKLVGKCILCWATNQTAKRLAILSSLPTVNRDQSKRLSGGKKCTHFLNHGTISIQAQPVGLGGNIHRYRDQCTHDQRTVGSNAHTRRLCIHTVEQWAASKQMVKCIANIDTEIFPGKQFYRAPKHILSFTEPPSTFSHTTNPLYTLLLSIFKRYE